MLADFDELWLNKYNISRGSGAIFLLIFFLFAYFELCQNGRFTNECIGVKCFRKPITWKDCMIKEMWLDRDVYKDI